MEKDHAGRQKLYKNKGKDQEVRTNQIPVY